MYVCKSCGNCYQFEGSSVTSVTNKLEPTERSKYEEETINEYADVDFLCCSNCGSSSVVNININDLPSRLQDQIYRTLKMGETNVNVAVELKSFLKHK